MSEIHIRQISGTDKEWVHEFMIKQWGADKIVIPNGVYVPSELPGFIAEDNGKHIGIVTYIYVLSACKIITLNSFEKHEGIGTLLLKNVLEVAKRDNLKEIVVTTTNDNVDALRFYQKRGFAIKNVYINEIENYRKIKPEISEIGEYGIPIRDDFELKLDLH